MFSGKWDLNEKISSLYNKFVIFNISISFANLKYLPQGKNVAPSGNSSQKVLYD